MDIIVTMIERSKLSSALNRSIADNPITALLGPRQCGKTTIARTLIEPAPVHYYDLENPADRAGCDRGGGTHTSIVPIFTLGNVISSRVA